MLFIIKNIILFGTSLVAKSILSLMGWSLLDNETLDRANKYNKSVMVFSHTSYADFYIFILYLLSYPEELKHVRTMVKPQPFRYAGWILRYFGAIPATTVDQKAGGSVERTLKELETNKKWLFLISPKGTILKREWRSGYYHIAHKTNSFIMVGGTDYEKKCITISDAISSDNEESTIKTFLHERLQQIVPLYPDQEVVLIRHHLESDRNIITNTRIFMYVAIIMCYFLTNK